MDQQHELDSGPLEEPGRAGTAQPVSRRLVLQLAVGVGAGVLGLGCPTGGAKSLRSGPDRGTPVARDVVLPEGLLEPQKTGTLSPTEAAVTWKVFDFIGRNWRNGAYNPITESALQSILRLKTQQVPSYYSEYQLALAVYGRLVARYGEERALRELYAIPANASLTTEEGHVRQYTLLEWLRLQVSQGAFRQLGYVNYMGYAGGRYDDPDHLPYRRAQP